MCHRAEGPRSRLRGSLLPGQKTMGGIGEIDRNQPGKGGKGERSALFRDRERNISESPGPSGR
jgi:hypothetical protein